MHNINDEEIKKLSQLNRCIITFYLHNWWTHVDPHLMIKNNHGYYTIKILASSIKNVQLVHIDVFEYQY